MSNRIDLGNGKAVHVDFGSQDDLSLAQSSFTPDVSLNAKLVDHIIGQEMQNEILQDKRDDLVKPRGAHAIAAAADNKVDNSRKNWELKTFGKPLTEVTIGDLVAGLRSENTETRRACAEALKEESKSDLRVLEKELRAATCDKDPRTAHYAQVCLDKAEVAVLVVPKLTSQQ